MIERFSKNEMEKRIHLYVNGQLSEKEIDELWAELIQDEYYLDYLKTVSNLKVVVERNRKQKRPAKIHTFWSYAAAAVITLTIGVLSVLYYPTSDTAKVKPIDSIELDYYRSGGESLIGEKAEARVIRRAVSMANTGKFRQAIALLTDELSKTTDPKWVAEINLNLGSLHYNEGNFQKAAHYFTEVKNAKNSIDILMLEKAYWYLGNAYFQMDQLAEAKQNIKKAYDINGAYRRVAKSYLDAMSDKAP